MSYKHIVNINIDFTKQWFFVQVYEEVRQLIVLIFCQVKSQLLHLIVNIRQHRIVLSQGFLSRRI